MPLVDIVVVLAALATELTERLDTLVTIGVKTAEKLNVLDKATAVIFLLSKFNGVSFFR
jgi:hypothetical protein